MRPGLILLWCLFYHVTLAQIYDNPIILIWESLMGKSPVYIPQRCHHHHFPFFCSSVSVYEIYKKQYCIFFYWSFTKTKQDKILLHAYFCLSFFFFKTVFIICHIFLNLLYNTCTSRQSYLLVRADFTRQNAVVFKFISPVSEYDYQINS